MPLWIVARVDELEDLRERARGDSASGSRYLKEFLFLELPRIDRVRHEHCLQILALAAQALHDPEEECLRELTILFAHTP